MAQNDVLDYIRKTPHNSNVNVVKGMLNADDGGSSDFSTATLTVTASNHGAIYGAPIIVAPFPDIPSFEFIGTATDPMGIGEHSVVMYKGYSAVFADYDPALSTVTTSGAIEKLLEEEGSVVYKITGDCTITIS